jgi:hypothetical protein
MTRYKVTFHVNYDWLARHEYPNAEYVRRDVFETLDQDFSWIDEEDIQVEEDN